MHALARPTRVHRFLVPLVLLLVAGCSQEAVNCGGCAPPVNVVVDTAHLDPGTALSVCYQAVCERVDVEAGGPERLSVFLYDGSSVGMSAQDVEGRTARAEVRDVADARVAEGRFVLHDEDGDCACDRSTAELSFPPLDHPLR